MSGFDSTLDLNDKKKRWLQLQGKRWKRQRYICSNIMHVHTYKSDKDEGHIYMIIARVH